MLLDEISCDYCDNPFSLHSFQHLTHFTLAAAKTLTSKSFHFLFPEVRQFDLDIPPSIPLPLRCSRSRLEKASLTSSLPDLSLGLEASLTTSQHYSMLSSSK
jgi:hypothetical protein